MNPLPLIDLIAAARPNFMKIAPLYHALAAEAWCRPRIVHTGQHYDPNMSDAFFADLGMPAPEVHLGVGSGMTVFRDGEIIGHADRFSSLHGFNGATLAARWFGLEGFSLAAVQFAEVVAYAGAGSDAMVEAETERLRTLYGL